MNGSRIVSVVLIAVLALSFVVVSPTKVKAGTPPTITIYGCNPAYGDVGEMVLFWFTYTDIDNDSLAAGYPKCTKLTFNWPSITGWVQNDTGDNNRADGQRWFATYFYYPVIGSTIFLLSVKSVGEVNTISVTVSTNQVLPSKPFNFGITPVTLYNGTYSFFFNYTSVWALQPHYVDIWVDGVVHNMTANDSLDVDVRDGKFYHYTTYLNSSLHVFSFHWAEAGGWYGDRTTGNHWIILLDEPEPFDGNKWLLGIVVILIIGIVGFIAFWPRKHQ